MKVETTLELESFSIIGITVRTDNSDIQKLTHDMQSLWGKFIAENIVQQIPDKVDDAIYCVYTDYAGDHTHPYTALLGCKVAAMALQSASLPTGLVAKQFAGGKYNKYLVKGNLLEGAVFAKWQEIWAQDIPRAYTADFEVYGANSQNLEAAEVEIFIAIRD